MSDLLAWSWLFTVPGLLLTASGAPRKGRAGLASLLGPVLLLVVSVINLLGGQGFASGDSFKGEFGFGLFRGLSESRVVFPDWAPFLPDTAFRLTVDPLSTLMLVVLGFVATVVYIYSLGYMADDPNSRRFFIYLDVFVAAMALLLLAGNLTVLLIGWTGVGITSFLLISFYRDRAASLGAGLQALAANAVGDAALLLAAVLVPKGCGELTTLGQAQCATGVGGVELIALLLFIAAAAKSAQGPLYFWLPSAMAGPTPISALIHAATMVAAGVYLLVRTHVVIEHAPNVAAWIAWIGVGTAIFASVASLLQPNFKKGVAYSTVAQLGYMFAAIGVGAPFAALFHLFTHAAFKALLFLSAGMVIHGSNGEESLARLSGQGRRFPFSYWGFLIGSLALIGVPLFSGAFSKDLILEAALAYSQPTIGLLLLGSVILTGLYIGRLFFRVYHGPLSDLEVHEEHEDLDSGVLMEGALVPLMLASVGAGFLGLGWLQGFLGTTAGEAHAGSPITPVGLAAAALGLIGFGASYFLGRGPLVERPAFLAGWVEGTSEVLYTLTRSLIALQNGNVTRYAFASLAAIAVIVVIRVSAR